MPSPGSIGIDFGTTNSVVARADGAGAVDLIDFATPDGPAQVFRSALCFWHDEAVRGGLADAAGPWAIAEFLDFPSASRFIQSFKSVAANSVFEHATLFEKRLRFEDLGQVFLKHLFAHSDGALADLPDRVVVGRPVRYVGARPDPALARARYDAMFALLGRPVHYVYEPIGAAFSFAARLTEPANLLVADFGGGTSDFSIVRFRREAGEIRSTPLANAGVGVAGDAFDYRIIEHLVSPELGRGSSYKTFDHIVPVPNRYFTAFARWEQLALLRASRDMRDIRGLLRTSLEPEKIARLVELLDANHGYRLYQAVSRLKEDLSVSAEAVFLFEAGSVRIEKAVTRQDFETWISPELAAIDRAVDQVLDRAGLSPQSIDRVFLTGGSSFVPSVRALFARRFGASKLQGGGELVSIASGLAYMGLESDLDRWSQSLTPQSESKR